MAHRRPGPVRRHPSAYVVAVGISPTFYEQGQIVEELQRVRASRVLEVGAFKGETTRLLCRCVRRYDGYVVAIDPMRWASEGKPPVAPMYAGG